MLPEEQKQLRIDELTKEMEAMRLQLKQLQGERENVQKTEKSAENASVVSVNKWACNPLLGVAVNYALTTGKRVMDKPIIPKDSTIRNKLTSLLHAFDTKLKIDSMDQRPMKTTTSRIKASNARTQVRVAPYTTDKVQSKRLTMQDALAYVDKVKLTFADQPEVYPTFLDIMQAYKNGTISFTDVIKKIKQLFGGHPELISGFSTFLPQAYNMNLPILDAELISPIISYYTRRLENEPEKYRSFLKILVTFNEKVHGQMSNNDIVLAEEEVMRQITELFKKKEDLVIKSTQNLDCTKKYDSTVNMIKSHSFVDNNCTEEPQSYALNADLLLF